MPDSNRDSDVKNRLLYSVGEGEESNIETCPLPYIKQMTSASSMHEAGHSKLVLWDNPEGWGGEGGRRGFRMGNTCTPVTDSCQCMATLPTIL